MSSPIVAMPGPKLGKALALIGRWNVEIVKRPDAGKDIKLLLEHYIVGTDPLRSTASVVLQ
jgi:hypothetical protein